MIKIGYLGPPGTFSELAARQHAAGAASELVPIPNIAGVLAAVESGMIHEGVVPLENSSEGPVGLTMDLLAGDTSVKIKGELIIPVIHHLLSRPGVKMESLERVLSHPQALAQSREFICKNIPRAELRETSSTAEAACIVSGSSNPWAAIGTEMAARMHKLDILASGINDHDHNTTRFIVVGSDDDEDTRPGDERCKTSVVVSIIDRPGALYSILREFALRDINLTSIESRPAKKRVGDYVFFIDLMGHRREPRVVEAMEAVSGQAVRVKVLGTYRADPAGLKKSLNHPVTPGDLEEVRAEIDIIDQQIVDLLGKRTRMAARAGRFKHSPSRVRDRTREEQVISRVRNIAENKGVDPGVVEEVYKMLIQYSVNLQINDKINQGKEYN